jgi:hypothetical protein
MLLLLVALLLTSCGGGPKTRDEGDVAVGDDSFLPSETTTTTAPAASATTPATPAPKASTATTAARATAPTTAGRSAPTTTVAPAPSAASGGRAFTALALQPGTTTIVFQFLQQPGTDPDPEAVSHLTTTFGKVSGKQVRVEKRQLPEGDPNQRWTDAALLATVGKFGSSNSNGGDTAYLRIVYAHGSWAASDRVLGVGVDDHLLVLPDRIKATANGVLPAATIEKVALLHEAGHCFGLVDMYLKTGREDPAYPAHSTNKRSVMYHGVDSTGITSLFEGGPPTDFDAADYADLANIKAGAAEGSKG